MQSQSYVQSTPGQSWTPCANRPSRYTVAHHSQGDRPRNIRADTRHGHTSGQMCQETARAARQLPWKLLDETEWSELSDAYPFEQTWFEESDPRLQREAVPVIATKSDSQNAHAELAKQTTNQRKRGHQESQRTSEAGTKRTKTHAIIARIEVPEPLMKKWDSNNNCGSKVRLDTLSQDRSGGCEFVMLLFALGKERVDATTDAKIPPSTSLTASTSGEPPTTKHNGGQLTDVLTPSRAPGKTYSPDSAVSPRSRGPIRSRHQSTTCRQCLRRKVKCVISQRDFETGKKCVQCDRYGTWCTMPIVSYEPRQERFVSSTKLFPSVAKILYPQIATHYHYELQSGAGSTTGSLDQADMISHEDSPTRTRRKMVDPDFWA